MKLPRVGGQVVAPIILILSLSSCGQISTTSASQPQSEEAQKLRQTIGQAVDGIAKLKKELDIQTNPGNAATAVPAVSIQPGKPPGFVDPAATKSFKELARLYENRDAPQNHQVGAQGDAKAFQNFIADQGQSTMAFAYQMRGDYQRAFEVITNQIAALEANNRDGSKTHRLAQCYAQCADYLNHLGRTGEAQQMLAKARAIEPNHY
jgi:hypothetical protein